MYQPFYFNLRDVFTDRFYVVPVYQRPYAWENLQAETIIDDLKNAFKKREELFTGTIYIKKLNDFPKGIYKYEIIDGQQRLTTFSLILMCIYVLASKAEISQHCIEFIDIKDILRKHVDNGQPVNLIESGSIEKELLNDLFEITLREPKNFEVYMRNFASDNKIELNLINALKKIYFSLHVYFFDNTTFNGVKMQEFTEYFLSKVTVIFIETKTSRRNVFEMFEAINSKGKQLEEIDLIKLYIFSQLDERDYNHYLEKWGQLLLRTNNELDDYIWIYIKAYLKFYQTSPNARHFKYLIEELTVKKTYFNTSQISIVLKNMIDELIKYVEFYRCLDNISDFKLIINDEKSVLQMNIYQTLRYEHIRPIIFRTIVEFNRDKNVIGVDKATEKFYAIIKSLNSFMIQFQSLSKMESKYTIPLVKSILTNHYKLNTLNSTNIHTLLNNRLLTEGFDEHWFEKSIKSFEAFKEKITDLGYIFHAIYESYDNENEMLNFSKTNFILENKKKIEANLIMPKETEKQDEFSYYKITKDKEEILKLKKDSDFPNTIQDGMSYEIFASQIISKIGNIKISYKITAYNPSISEYKFSKLVFNTYKKLEARSNEIAAIVILADVFSLYSPNANVNPIGVVTTNIRKLDFENLSDLTFSKPVSVKLFGDEFIPINNRDVAKIIFDYLYELDDSKFPTMLDGRNDCGSPTNHWFSTSESTFISSKRIKNSPYYFNAQKSAVDLMIMIMHVFNNIYGYDLHNLEIYYEK